jgi:hypothetical protein
MRHLLGLIAVSTLLFLAGASARGETITYTYSTMVTSEGADTAGLNGATFTINAMFSSTDKYVSFHGVPEVLADPGATYTITGASNSLNDGTFAFPITLAFFATGAELYVSEGSPEHVTLGNGVELTMNLEANPSSHGAAVHVGDTINTLDFAPATPINFVWVDGNSTDYDQSNSTVSVSEPSVVPEPSSLALCGIAGLVGLVVVRVRCKRSA